MKPARKDYENELISIICCSSGKGKTESLLVNIESTIGANYEKVIIDNSTNRYSIAEAYNLGVGKASGNILCFCHDDIEFRSKDWGLAVTHHLQSFDVIGVSGNNSHPDCPSGWWIKTSGNRIYSHLWQQIDYSNPYISSMLRFSNAEIIDNKLRVQENCSKETNLVLTLDGFWMCFKREVFQHLRFDESLEGFHGYDIDICLQAYGQFKLAMVSNIEIVHYSAGNINTEWCLTSWKVYEKWKTYLPISIDKNADLSIMTIVALFQFIIYLVDNNYTQKEIRDFTKTSFKMEMIRVDLKYFLYIWFSLRCSALFFNTIRKHYVRLKMPSR